MPAQVLVQRAQVENFLTALGRRHVTRVHRESLQRIQVPPCAQQPSLDIMQSQTQTEALAKLHVLLVDILQVELLHVPHVTPMEILVTHFAGSAKA